MQVWVALLALLSSPAHAECPDGEPVLAELACDSEVPGDLLSGGFTEYDWIYECGSPDSGILESGPEDLYSFECTSLGEVTVEVHDAICDFDLYILSDECSPRGDACLGGNTGIARDPVVTSFMCEFVGQTRYVIVEGRGLIDPAGPCTAPDAGEYTVEFNTVSGACDIQPLVVSEDPIPGTAGVENEFRGEGGRPDGVGYLVVGTRLEEGPELPGCPGTRLPVNGFKRFGSGRINPGGFVNRSVEIPDAASGLTTYVVWVDLDACEISPPYRYDWP
jgi:hypothetical protein